MVAEACPQRQARSARSLRFAAERCALWVHWISSASVFAFAGRRTYSTSRVGPLSGRAAFGVARKRCQRTSDRRLVRIAEPPPAPRHVRPAVRPGVAALTLLDQFFSRSRSRSARADPSQRESRRNRAPAASTAGWDAGRLGSRHSQKLRSCRLFSFSRRSDQVVLELVLGVGPQGRAPDPGSAVLVLSLDYGV